MQPPPPDANGEHEATTAVQPPPPAWWQRAWMRLWPSWITRDSGLLLVARIFMSAARALAGIVVPVYLAVIGYSGLTLGVLFAVVAFASAGLSALIGILSDRVGRKPFIVLVPWLAALAALAFAFSRAEVLLFVFAALGSFGRGAGAGAGAVGPYQPAESALLAETVPARHRNSLFGRVAFASSLGALLGAGPFTALPAVLMSAGILSPRGLASYRLLFCILAGLALAAGLIALPITERRPRARIAAAPPSAGGPSTSRRTRFRSLLSLSLSPQTWPILLRLWATNSINGLAIGFFGPFITYWFYRRYGVGPAEIGLLFSVINLAALFVNLGAASFAKRLGLVRAITVGRTFQAVLMIPMVLAPTFWLAGAFYLVRMMAQRLALPLRQSYVLGVVPPEERGTVGALSNLPAQATSAMSPTFAGYLFDHAALALPFEIGAILQGINATLFFLFFRNRLPPEERGVPSVARGIAASGEESRAKARAESHEPEREEVGGARIRTRLRADNRAGRGSR